MVAAGSDLNVQVGGGVGGHGGSGCGGKGGGGAGEREEVPMGGKMMYRKKKKKEKERECLMKCLIHDTV